MGHDGQVPLFSFEGRAPQVSPQAWIAPTATLGGDVRVEAEASVWYGPVLASTRLAPRTAVPPALTGSVGHGSQGGLPLANDGRSKAHGLSAQSLPQLQR